VNPVTDISNHIVGRTLLGGRPQLSDEAKQAMRLVESLVNGGLIELGDDAFVSGEQRFRMRSTNSSEPAHAIEGEAMSFALDPLESAIASTVGLMNDHAVFLSESNLGAVDRAGMKFLGEKLNSHLNHLLAAQLKQVTEHE
jgi:hypothetical protein